jgi:hypothetical protein
LGKIANSFKDPSSEAEITLTLRTTSTSRASGSRKSSVALSTVEGGVDDAEDKKPAALIKVEEGEENSEPEEESSEGTVVGDAIGTGKRDELLDELLSDGDVEMSGL